MRGIILAGGTGSRLLPLTKSINKHVLPVGGVPMIYHPLRVLRDNGINDITIVSSPSGVGQLAMLLGSGHEHGCTFTYRVQDQPGGIAQALLCAEYGTDEDVAVILGDNVFLPSPDICTPMQQDGIKSVCFLYPAKNLSELGVALFGSPGRLDLVIEKPEKPPGKLAVTGLYVFDPAVFDGINAIPKSPRGEAEITDILNAFIRMKSLAHVEHDGFWGDAGTFDGLAECDEAVRRHNAINHG